MRRMIALLLLAILPLQTAWAALASHCQHEITQGLHAVGHHAPHAAAGHDCHQGAHVDRTQANPEDADHDCCQCHIHPLGVIEAAPILATALASTQFHPPQKTFRAFNPVDRPERPKWSRLA